MRYTWIHGARDFSEIWPWKACVSIFGVVQILVFIFILVWSSAYQGYRDIWAIGVIAYFLLCGYTPFDRETTAEEMQAILAGDYAFEPEEYWQDVSDKARDFIIKCLVVDADKRMSAEEALVHPFLFTNTKRNKRRNGFIANC